VKNEAAAVALYQKAAAQGHATAICNLGVMYEHGLGIDKDLYAAAAWYRSAADKGNATAQNNLGALLDRESMEITDKPPLEEALWYFQLASDQGYGPAKNNLGQMHENGRGVPVDLAEACKLYAEAGKVGTRKAMTNLGRVLCAGGNGITADLQIGMKWLEAGAQAGDPEAMNLLGTRYASGHVVSSGPFIPDLPQALMWFRRAADDCDNVAGQVNAALLLQQQKQYDEALAYLHKALNKGHVEAQRLIDECNKRKETGGASFSTSGSAEPVISDVRLSSEKDSRQEEIPVWRRAAAGELIGQGDWV